MKVVGLISGGKDSCYAMMECVAAGHEIVCLANLYPERKAAGEREGGEEGGDGDNEELDSQMFQSVGVEKICPAIAQCMEVPLVQKTFKGKALVQSLEYTEKQEGDEVEELYDLLEKVKQEYGAEAVCSGAVLSNYQRNRVENVCSRLGMQSIALLWQRKQKEVLDSMINAGVNAIIVKIASLGMKKDMLGKTIAQLKPALEDLEEKFGFHVCGEGGEYESITLDCPLFKSKRIVIDKARIVVQNDDKSAPVAHYKIEKLHVEPKPTTILPLIKHRSMNQDTPIINKKSSNLISINGCTSSLKADDESVTVAEHVSSAMEQLKSALGTQNLTLENVCFVHLYLADLKEFGTVNGRYCTFFENSPPPSRACVELPMPENCKLIINAFASPSPRSVLHVKSISKWAPVCIGPYAQSNVLDSGLRFIAGQVAFDPVSMQIAHVDDPYKQLKLALCHCAAVLESQNSSIKDAISLLVYVSDSAGINAKDLFELVEIFFCSRDSRIPPMSFIRCPRLPLDALVEVEMVTHENSSDSAFILHPKKQHGTSVPGIYAQASHLHVPETSSTSSITIHVENTCQLQFDHSGNMKRACNDIVNLLIKEGYDSESTILKIFYDSTLEVGLQFANHLVASTCPLVKSEAESNFFQDAVLIPVDGIITDPETDKARIAITVLKNKFQKS